MSDFKIKMYSVDFHRQVHTSISHTVADRSMRGAAAASGGGPQLPSLCVAGVGLHRRPQVADPQRLLQARLRWIRYPNIYQI